METSQVVDAQAGEEPVIAPSDAAHPGPLPASAYPEGADPLPETPTAPELTPGSITLSTGQTESVADISIVDGALAGAPGDALLSREWLSLRTASGAPFKVRASEIVRYQ